MQLKAALRGHSYDTQVQMLAPDGGRDGAGGVHAAAAHGVSGTGQALPHLAQIQKSFGGYDISHVQAHSDAAATKANEAMGAAAYASGNHVALGPKGQDLHTVAHEAAHVVQQRSGVSLSGGVGQAGDPYERHADAVADRVVQGQSAEDLLGQMHGGSGGSSVQMRGDPKADVDLGEANADRKEISGEPDNVAVAVKPEMAHEVPTLQGVETRTHTFLKEARKALMAFQAAAQAQKNRDDGKVRMGAALEDANRAARAKALVEFAVGLPDLANTLLNIKTVLSATTEYANKVTTAAALSTVKAPAFGPKISKEMGNTYKGALGARTAARRGDADATITAARVAGEISIENADTLAREHETTAYMELDHALRSKEQIIKDLQALQQLGLDSLSEYGEGKLNRIVDDVNEGIAVLRQVPLLQTAVALEVGSAMAEGTPSRSLIDMVAEDKLLQKGLRVVRILSREFVVSDDDTRELPVKTRSNLKALTEDARLAVQDFGFWALSPEWGGWVTDLPEASVTVLGVLLETEARESPNVIVRSEGAFPVSMTVSRKEWLANRPAIVARVRASRKEVDAYEEQAHMPGRR